MGGDLLGVLAFGIVVVTGVAWFRLIKAVRIPSNRLAFFAAMGVGVVLGIAAFGQGTGVLGGLAAGFAIPDERGEPFDLASLRGRPYLLKFFRGHW
jgi:cytochrome oxidase Cu insertion factor (SCO1/SenC/PrrC family)